MDSISAQPPNYHLDFPAQFPLGSAVPLLRGLEILYPAHGELCCSHQHCQVIHPDLPRSGSPSPANKERAKQVWGNPGLKQQWRGHKCSVSVSSTFLPTQPPRAISLKGRAGINGTGNTDFKRVPDGAYRNMSSGHCFCTAYILSQGQVSQDDSPLVPHSQEHGGLPDPIIPFQS